MLTPRPFLGLFALLVLRGSNSFVTLAAVLPLHLQIQSYNQSSTNGSTPLFPFEITQDSSTPALRSAGIDTKRASFLYGPPIAGGPFYPAGPLALTKKSADLTAVQLDETPELTGSTLDGTEFAVEVAEYDGLRTLEDYVKLYDGRWETTLPGGPNPGVLTNYSQDLFFSMERLANSPYQVRRLDPASDSLAFEVEDSVVRKLANRTLNELFLAGRLFHADYRDQNSNNLTPTGLRYAASCDAYFYIHPVCGDFLPLAIRTNVGANLIYTPADSFGDWTLAKILLNVNDFWFAQWHHLAQTHEVVQINYMAAIRTLSEQHPVLGLLNHLMFEVFAIQPLAMTILFTPGTTVDSLFAFSGPSAQDYTTDRYFNKGAGAFKSNYFEVELEQRGLLNSKLGPKIKHFPFYEDASIIHTAIEKFMTSFVASYYKNDAAVAADAELQAWATEANGPAQAIDFPYAISSKKSLADILTHFAHLSTVAHHAVNTNELGRVSATLPFHPAAIYKEPPTSKSNDTDVASFLPPLQKCIRQFHTNALFARPKLAGTKRSLMYMFDDPLMLRRMNNQTAGAAGEFTRSMQAFSDVVSQRTFGGDELSQGMPFVWRELDPGVAPWGITT